MKKLLMISAVALSIGVTSVQAIKVESGSKYPVLVEVYEWKSVCKDKGSSAASKAFTGAKNAYKSGGLFSGLREAVSGAVTGSGCDRVGGAHELLNKGDSIEVPAGVLIVAYKDPVMAYQNVNGKGSKIVNPLPAITQVPNSGKVVLETRKSKGLGSITGFKGDLGLKATLK